MTLLAIPLSSENENKNSNSNRIVKPFSLDACICCYLAFPDPAGIEKYWWMILLILLVLLFILSICVCCICWRRRKRDKSDDG